MLLLSWDLDKDVLREGQWLKGRIYERRCDLSPSGERLVYFAANQKPPYGTWTAVSRPPWLTALALWPKGDAWGGGGLFASENLLLLNHPPSQQELAQGRAPIHVGTCSAAGRGEDEPIEAERRQRDGWVLRHPGKAHRFARGWNIDPPRWWIRPSPRGRLELSERLTGRLRRGEPAFEQTYSLSGRSTEIDLGQLDWADWDKNGDLLLARDGRLLRLSRDSLRDPSSAREVADLRALRFSAREAPEPALHW